MKTQWLSLLSFGHEPPLKMSRCSRATSPWLLASRARIELRSTCRFEMLKAITPRDDNRVRYDESASLVMRCIGTASELKASSTMRPNSGGDALASDSLASPRTTRHRSPQWRRYEKYAGSLAIRSTAGSIS